MINLLLVALGGAAGALFRYGVNGLLYPVFGDKFPLATMAVNVVGSFVMGILYVLIVERAVMPMEYRQLLMIGLLGAFTTFSSFSLDTLALWQNGHLALALFYVTASVLLCLLGTFSALALTRYIS